MFNPKRNRLFSALLFIYGADLYHTHENWKNKLNRKPVRLQWDPDHDIYGDKQERKAIQLGIKGELLKDFGKRMILNITDITEYVYVPNNKQVQNYIGLYYE